MSVPMVRRRCFWSTLKPMPRPTSRMTEVIPQTMPNIVRKLRSFVLPQRGERLLEYLDERHDGADPW